jgi:single-strand DNA-binding protein
MYNTIIALGHLVSDPVLRTTGTGKNICTMRLCISDGAAKNKCFIDVESWEKTADACAKFLVKGREVLVEGELSVSVWEKDGKPQSKNFIRANKVKFVGGQKKDAPASGSSTSAPVDSDDDSDIPF